MKILTVQNYKRGLIPKALSFQVVADKLREAILNSKAIYGGVIIGSAAQGDCSASSNLNIVVGFQGMERPDISYNRVVDALKPGLALAHKLHVPVDVSLYELGNVVPHYHTIDGNFCRVIEYFEKSRGVIKNPISHALFPGDTVPRSCAAAYMAKKVTKLRTTGIHYDWLDHVQQADFLSDIINAPINATRYLILSLTNNVSMSHGTTRTEMLAIFRSHASIESSEYLTKIIKLGNTYNALLEADNRDVAKYEEIWSTIRTLLPQTIEFLENNMFLV